MGLNLLQILGPKKQIIRRDEFLDHYLIEDDAINVRAVADSLHSFFLGMHYESCLMATGECVQGNPHQGNYYSRINLLFNLYQDVHPKVSQDWILHWISCSPPQIHSTQLSTLSANINIPLEIKLTPHTGSPMHLTLHAWKGIAYVHNVLSGSLPDSCCIIYYDQS